MGKFYTSLKSLLVLPFILCAGCQPKSSGNKDLPEVRPVRLASIDPTLFSVEEWYVPYYLNHFARVANSVSEVDTMRGFFDLSVWRGTRNHHTYNARIMEGILSLVWFYTKDRPWNPYFRDKAVKARIEAALDFWCDIQHTDGSFSEYRVGRWSLAPTAFATKFIGQALWLLDEGPGIDAKVFERSREALRKAIHIGFTSERFWDHGINYTNQYANLWGGALCYLDRWPDEEIEQLLRERMKQSMTAFQSPAGFFYEKGGPDWSYNLSTHHSDLQVAWHYAPDQEIRDMIVEKTARWYDWFAYNAVKEPGSPCYYLNRAVETRQHMGFYKKAGEEDPAAARWVPQAEFVPEAHAFEPSREELRKFRKEKYIAVQQDWPRTASLQPGEFTTYSPYAFLHDEMAMWLPTAGQKKQSIANLPYLASDDFIHVRHDDRSETSYFFIRKPAYYAIFNTGGSITPQQRFGVGLVWHPGMGTVFQSQSRSNQAAWGTRAGGTEQVYEAAGVPAGCTHNGTAWAPAAGKNDLTSGTMVFSYAVGDTGQKKVRFTGEGMSVSIRHPGSFTEIIPLLIGSGDQLSYDQSEILLQTDKGTLRIGIDGASAVRAVVVDEELDEKVCHALTLKAAGALDYTFAFE